MSSSAFLVCCHLRRKARKMAHHGWMAYRTGFLDRVGGVPYKKGLADDSM